MNPEIVIIMGYPASGKTTYAEELVSQGYVRLNRDIEGGKVIDLVPKMIAQARSGKKRIVIDNLFPSIASRKPFIDAAGQIGLPIRCVWVDTSIEDAQMNACLRMVRKHGKLLMPGDKQPDPNSFPIVVMFKYRNEFETPTVAEGFAGVTKIKFVRKWGAEYKNKAVIFDYDGTLRKSKGDNEWPEKPEDVELLPDRKKVINLLRDNGHWLLGVSNQSAIAKGLPASVAEKCFHRTNSLLDVGIDFLYCPHRANPPSCWCRKPQVGLGIVLIEKYKLNPAECVFVGDMTTDKTFAQRCGFKFMHADEFFGRQQYKALL